MTKAKQEQPRRAGSARPEGCLTMTKPKSNTIMYIMRILLWGLIVIVFIRGLVTFFRPDTEAEALRAIADFREELASVRMIDSEILSFAEMYAVTWLSGFAEPLYVRAYRKESYSNTQYDVFVFASVLFSEENHRNITIQVPVAVHGNRYIVEDTPLFVNDDNTLHEHIITPHEFVELDRAKQSEILAFLSDFFGELYSERQGILDNFLSPDADSVRFRAMGDLLTFERIEPTSRVYRGAENSMIALVGVTVLTNGDDNTSVRQNFTVRVIERDRRFYVERLDSRINNLNY
jgi:hypothetical protein